MELSDVQAEAISDARTLVRCAELVLGTYHSFMPTIRLEADAFVGRVVGGEISTAQEQIEKQRLREQVESIRGIKR